MLKEAEALRNDLPELVAHVLDYYREKLAELYPEDFPKRQRDLDTLSLLADRYPSLQDFLAQVSLEPPESAEATPEDEDDEWLTLSTVHSAKGLEWHSVFVLQLGDGAFPSGYALEDDEGMEEERRLFYVAVTRARERLFLVQPRMIRRAWGSGFAPTCALLDTVEGLDDLVTFERWQPPQPQKDPEIAAAEARLARFLDFYR